MKQALTVVVVALCVTPASIRAAQWHQTPGPGGRVPQAAAVHPANPKVVLVGRSGLFRTDDAGQTWERIVPVRAEARLTYAPIAAIAFSPTQPDTVYCIARATLLASTDAGRRWQVRSRSTVLVRTRVLAIDPYDPERIYLVLDQPRQVKGPSLLMSRDGGRTLEGTALPEGLWLRRFHPDPHHAGVLLADLLEDDVRRILVSRDYASTWATLSHPTGHIADLIVWHAADPEDASIIHLATRRIGDTSLSIWSTSADGKTWKRSTRPPADAEATDEASGARTGVLPRRALVAASRECPIENVLMSPSEPNTIYHVPSAQTTFALHRSLDGGATWEDIGTRIPDAEVQHVRRHPTDPDTVFARVAWVYYRTDDAGQHWRRFMPDGAPIAYQLAVHPLRPKTLFMSDLIRAWRSDDDGASWRVVYDDGNHPVLNVVFDASDENTYHLVHPTLVRTTTDDGTTWTERPFKDHEITGNLVVAYGGKPVAVELRDGETFIFTPGEQPRLLEVNGEKVTYTVMAFHPKDGTRMVLLGDDGLYGSTDAGRTWTRTTAPNRPGGFWYWSFDPTEETVLLLFDQGGGVTSWDYATGRRSVVSSGGRLKGDLRCATIAPDGRTLWAGTVADGVWRLERQK